MTTKLHLHLLPINLISLHLHVIFPSQSHSYSISKILIRFYHNSYFKAIFYILVWCRSSRWKTSKQNDVCSTTVISLFITFYHLWGILTTFDETIYYRRTGYKDMVVVKPEHVKKLKGTSWRDDKDERIENL